MTTYEALRSLCLYPIPQSVLENCCEEAGLENAEATLQVRASRAYLHAKALVFRWLSVAPKVNEDGVSYEFTDKQRADFANKADAIEEKLGIENAEQEDYGYKGEFL